MSFCFTDLTNFPGGSFVAILLMNVDDTRDQCCRPPLFIPEALQKMRSYN